MSFATHNLTGMEVVDVGTDFYNFTKKVMRDRLRYDRYLTTLGEILAPVLAPYDPIATSRPRDRNTNRSKRSASSM